MAAPNGIIRKYPRKPVWPWLGVLSGLTFLATSISCTDNTPPPRQPTPIPTASTSATPLYVSNEPAASSAPATPKPSYAPVPPELPDTNSLAGIQERVASCGTPRCVRRELLPPKVWLRTEDGPAVQAPGTTVAKARPELGWNPPVALWRESIEKQSTLVLPRVAGVTLFGVVLSGSLVMKASEQPRTTKELEPWMAFRAPGAGLSLQAASGPVNVLLVAVHADGNILGWLADWKKQGHKEWKTRAGKVTVLDFHRVAPLAWAGGAARARLAFEKDVSPDAYLGQLSLSGEVPVPEHDHPHSWEILFAISGNGTLVFSGKGRLQRETRKPQGGSFPLRMGVTAGSVLMVPPGVHHAWEPGHGVPLQAIQLYVGPGPEQRYKKLATPIAE